MFSWQSIIIVEDVFEIAEAYQNALESAGADVRVVESIEEAVAAAEAFPPDAIVTTARMLDGRYLELRAEIALVCADEYVPIVVMSEDSFVRGERTFQWSTFDADEVVDAVAHAINHQSDATWSGRGAYAAGRYGELFDAQPGAFA